jgi:hypothetical protein
MHFTNMTLQANSRESCPKGAGLPLPCLHNQHSQFPVSYGTGAFLFASGFVEAIQVVGRDFPVILGETQQGGMFH